MTTRSRKPNLIPQIAIMSVLIVSLCAAIPLMIKDKRSAIIVIRIDDIQDYAFRDAQLYLLEYNIENQIPASLAIIAREFGADKLLVETVKSAVHLGSEVVVHGWEHEDLTQLSLQDQKTRLQNAKRLLRETLGFDATTLAPPMFNYNEDTLTAMQVSGYKTVTGLSELQQQGQLPKGILSIPATIEVSDYTNGTWAIKSLESLVKEINTSILVHSYATILTHPQEFLINGTLDQNRVEIYKSLTQYIETYYFFTTLDRLREKILQENS